MHPKETQKLIYKVLTAWVTIGQVECNGCSIYEFGGQMFEQVGGLFADH